jgi:glycosyltransferase involved in cell wall biosynthesis/Tfp pilus assembly protein PilF
LAGIRQIQEADILHLHWVAGMLNYSELEKLGHGKPVVWTLHDMNPFTGGCHYAGTCSKFTEQCGACPQLGSTDKHDLANVTWQAKAGVYTALSLNLVAPSRWLRDCIAQSSLMGRFPLRVIPYSLPLERFYPMPHTSVRQRYSIPEKAKVVLFGADDTSNPRKGLRYLWAALNQLDSGAYTRENLYLVVFGDFFKAFQLNSPFNIITTGRITDTEALAQLYSTADVFVLPSLEDNLPNTALEAMACGTPVVGFASGGIIDIVDHKQTGYLAAKGDGKQLAEGIDWVLTASSQGIPFRQMCRNKAEKTYAYKNQSEAYLRLYNELTQNTSKTKKASGVPDADWPKISVVTPSFNQADYLEACIRSVLEQDYPNIEYIIMDGGSQDGSGQIMQYYAHRLAYWRSMPDGGQYAAIQEGFSRSTGEIMTWINADDVLHSGALKKAAAIFMQRKDIEWITGRPNGIDDKGKQNWVMPILPLWSRKRYLEKKYKAPYIQQEGTFWRRSLWQKSGAGMDTSLQMAGDLELWTRFFRHAMLYSVDCLLGAFRSHHQQKTAENLSAYNAEAEIILDKEFANHTFQGREPPAVTPVPLAKEQVASYLRNAIINAGSGKKQRIVPEQHDEKKQTLAGRTPLVSAIVSTYNSERFMRGCLEDLLAQTIADKLEIIVVDSASLQNEGAIVRDFQQRFGNIKYMRTPKRETVYQAWNRGIKLAGGSYITNANTDDRHRHDAFERMAGVLDENEEIALVYADVIKTNRENQTFNRCTPAGVLHWYPWNRNTLLAKGCFIGPQPIWRRSLHDAFGYFDERFSIAADYEFWLRISQFYDFQHIDIPLGLYLERQESVEHANAEEKRLQDKLVNQRYCEALAASRVLGYEPFKQLRQAAQTNDNKLAVHALQATRCACLQRWGQEARILLAGIQSLVDAFEEGRASQEKIDDLIQQVGAAFLYRRPPQEHFKDMVVHQHFETERCDLSAGRLDKSPQGGADMQIVNQIHRAIQHLLQTGYSEAVHWILDKALADFPQQALFHYEKALYAHNKKDETTALSHFQRAADLEPQNIEYQKSLGDCLHVTHGKIDAAMDQYRKVLSLDPTNVETLATIGHLSVARREFEQARAYYEKALAVDPDQAEVRQILDKLQANLQPEDPVAGPMVLFEKAQNDLKIGNKSRAKQLLEQVVAADPRFAQAHNDLGVLLFESGDKDGALTHYEKAAQLKPEDPVFLKNLADFLYIEMGNIEGALRKYVQALTLNPQDCEALLASGHICLTVGQKEDAAVFFSRVLEIEPWNQTAQQLLSQLHTLPSPSYCHVSDEALYKRAQSEAKGGQPEMAIKTLKMLIAQDPDYAAAYNDLGVLFYELGDKNATLEYYEQATRLEPENATFLKNLADFYYVEQGRTEEALNLYVKILERDREDIDSLMAAGTICTHLDKFTDARVFFERVLEIEPWHHQSANALRELDSKGGHPFSDAADRAANQ